MKDIGEYFILLPVIIEYFVPGYVFVATWQFFTSRSLKNENIHIVICMLISSVIRIIDRFLYHTIPCFEGWSLNDYGKSFILILSGFAFGVIIAALSTSRCIGQIVSFVSHKSIHESVFREIINYDGCSLILTCKDGRTIYGKLNSHEEKGADSLFALTDYIIDYPCNEKGQYEHYDSKNYGFDTAIIVRLSDIETFQVFNASK